MLLYDCVLQLLFYIISVDEEGLRMCMQHCCMH